MAKTKLPAGPTELTADWLTGVLRETDVISDASVTGLDHEIIGQGVGVLGQLARFRLSYDKPEDGAPGRNGGGEAPAGGRKSGSQTEVDRRQELDAHGVQSRYR